MLTLDLKPETERRLRRAAERAGKPLEAFVEEVIAALPADTGQGREAGRKGTGAELLAELKALRLSPEYGDAALSAEEYARELRAASNRPRHA